ncbi:MAG: family 20 glycosylhydrolase [Bacteroidota bacterium]
MSLIYKSIALIFVFFLNSCEKDKTFTEGDIQIIPKPVELILDKGVFQFSENTQFVVVNASQKEIANTLVNKFKKTAGWNLKVLNTKPQNNYIQFIIDGSLTTESYNLTVSKETIRIKASGNAGFIYGLETIRQLLPVAIESKEIVSNTDWVIPNLTIQDQPRFKWRGLMLDLSRHFFEKEYIKSTIDRLAMHKMNVLHLHLVDDQGWRIEIEKYPKLTEIGAWREDQEDIAWNGREKTKAGKKGTYGGYLSQADLKEIVAYAATRNIEIIPEIEMPAHVMSAIAAYPELSCFETPIGVPSGGVWPITEIYCAGKESTFEFLENVLLEVMEIFPSKYIHIGGDEATKTNWEKCQHCKKRMKKEGLKDVEELQSYFVKRMEKFINSHGKKLIGWDEILEGGLAPEATVMSWRGVKGGLEAAAQGHDVVMTPGSHCYFDHYQGPQNEEPIAFGGFLPLSKVYQFDPIIDSMNEEEAKHVLGGQANLWSEFITTNSHSEYMIYPRIAALAEVVWSPKELRDWNDFSDRIKVMFNRYEFLGINYAKSSYLLTASSEADLKRMSVQLKLQNEFPNADIRYVLGDEELNKNANKYIKSIELKETTTIKASLFEDEKPVGRVFTDTIKFHKAVAHKVSYTNMYSDNYKGSGEFNLVNTLRGTKNFHDGKWQGWIGENMEVIIDLEKEEEISQVTVGSMENQGAGIYYPIAVEVLISMDGKSYQKAGEIKRGYAKNYNSELKNFIVKFPKVKTRFIKVNAIKMKQSPSGGGVWLFVDEILVD